ncbi:conserved membrane hypothetical protein [Frankia canadensis]|uniref:DUF4231 domain-containing protein n=1 Tax=Frankia canadensis TaxID=1836972 RepID=A0A2I2KXA6_9ACTN|nr:DUF4231 domain-containing protein [Frankia canadensis]SNQ50289.1 conserved membrane hypothetical protein [Frankia canadensis]SOU57579.1 conserved membrane hypothetical protein [Frankia canadensis]
MPDPSTEEDKRENSKNIDLKETAIREFRVAQRLRMLWILASLIVALLLGAATVAGLWQSYPVPFSYVGLFAGALSTAFAAREIIIRRPNLARLKYELIVLQNEQTNLAAQSAADPVTALRIYRVASRADVSRYSRAAARNRRVHNTFQGIIIVGSIAVTSLTSAGSAIGGSRWLGAGLAAAVSISAGFTGYFKYRERSFNQQQTADAIAKESKAVELGIGDYGGKEEDALRQFALKVEELKEEQRKKELQLEQTSNPRDASQT